MATDQAVHHDQNRARHALARLASGGVAGLAVLATAIALTAPSASASPASPTKASTAKASSQAPTADDWSAYLDGPQHASYSASQTYITPLNASSLTAQWKFTTPGYTFQASPTVADGAVFIGSENGWFYKLSIHTGKVLDKVFLGYQPKLTCPANGITSTATVAVNPANKVLTVYVAGADGYLYALRASNLHTEWRSVIGIPSKKVSNYYDWSSPTVSHSRVYVGIASSCDHPLVRGGLIAFEESTGKKLGEYFTVPAGADNAGGSVWSSIGVAPDGDVYATTGNGPADAPRLQNSESILKLSPVRLRLLGSFKVPQRQVTTDGDFGGSPVFFGSYVGACNKNGIFYTLSQATMKLAWWKRIANASGGTGECIATPAYNGTDLFFGGGKIVIDGTQYPGSVQERSPSTGAVQWTTPVGGNVIGSPTLDGGGVLAVGAYGGTAPGIYLINAATSDVIEELQAGSTFGQSVFAREWLFTANGNGVTAWGLPTS